MTNSRGYYCSAHGYFSGPVCPNCPSVEIDSHELAWQRIVVALERIATALETS